jgi:hypothetical protein
LNSCETIPVQELESRQVFEEPTTIPPFAPTCRAEAIPGHQQYARCLVDENLACCYRSCLSTLGSFCLHPHHREIAARTAI